MAVRAARLGLRAAITLSYAPTTKRSTSLGPQPREAILFCLAEVKVSLTSTRSASAPEPPPIHAPAGAAVILWHDVSGRSSGFPNQATNRIVGLFRLMARMKLYMPRPV